MVITLDTNIIYQALRNPKGASGFIFKLFAQRILDIALSEPVFKEYEDVLKRSSSLKDIGTDIKIIDDILSYVAFWGIEHKIYYLFRPNLKDEKDNILVELAVSSQSKFIVTSNTKDFMNSELIINIPIITPAEFVKKWRSENEN